MTLQEILKARGISDAEIANILGGMRDNKIFVASEENLDVRYGKLKGEHEKLKGEHEKLKGEHEKLNGGSGAGDDLQAKLGEYENRMKKLEADLTAAKVGGALNAALTKANVSDIDYMAFKVREKGELVLDESGNIKGIDDVINQLKTQYPQHFKAEGDKRIVEKKLGGTDHETTMTKKELFSKSYAERLKIYESDPEGYEKIVAGE